MKMINFLPSVQIEQLGPQVFPGMEDPLKIAPSCQKIDILRQNELLI